MKYDEERDRFVRVRRSEGILFAAPVDSDGWVRLKLPIDESWKKDDVAGIMMLTLNEELERVGMELFKKEFAKLRGALRGSQISLSLNPVTDKRELSRIFGSTLSPDDAESDRELDAIKAYIEKLARPVFRELIATLWRPSGEIRSALIELPRLKQKLCFAFGSCQYPAGLLDGEIADRSMRLLAKRLDQPERERPRPEFLLLLGDQIYVDATAGLFDPTSMDDRFVRPYEMLYDRAWIQAVLRRIPAYMMLDDHEIDDNWEPGEEDIRNDTRLLEARRSYWRYQRFDNFQKPARDRPHELSFDFEHAGCPFYVLDTRTRRSARTARNAR